MTIKDSSDHLDNYLEQLEASKHYMPTTGNISTDPKIRAQQIIRIVTYTLQAQGIPLTNANVAKLIDAIANDISVRQDADAQPSGNTVPDSWS